MLQLDRFSLCTIPRVDAHRGSHETGPSREEIEPAVGMSCMQLDSE